MVIYRVYQNIGLSDISNSPVRMCVLRHVTRHQVVHVKEHQCLVHNGAFRYVLYTTFSTDCPHLLGEVDVDGLLQRLLVFKTTYRIVRFQILTAASLKMAAWVTSDAS
jgi:hypothetical protein